MLTDNHIFTIKTKDTQNVSNIQNLATNVVISGLNVHKDKIQVGDLIFVVFGGDNPPWQTGLVGLAQISQPPFDEGYDGKRNFRVCIDIKAYFEPIVRGDLVTYPDTYDIIGIGPITKWEPNQAITAVEKDKAIALLQAICDLRPETRELVKNLLKNDFFEIPTNVNRYTLAQSILFNPDKIETLSDEKIVNNSMKTVIPTPYASLRSTLAFQAGNKNDELLLRLLSALRAKPFAILAGHSGTGKSRYAKKLAYMTCNANELRFEGQLPGNYLLLQVKPNWHDSTDLLGFRNALDGNRYQKTALIEFLFKAYHFKDTPFFLCLDEMNLAPVEQYFAEFLSAMESTEAIPLNDITQDEDNLFELGCKWTDSLDYLKTNKFSIPKNLFIVGTVNMDETTNQFSRKVLDRAFTIEMSDVDFHNFGKVEEPSYNDTIEEQMIQALLNGNKIVEKLDDDDLKEGSSLIKIQKALEPTAFAIAYRFANEYTLLKRAIEVFDPDNTMNLDALDQAVLMKILPRIAGEKDYIEQVYNGKDSKKGLIQALEGKTASLEKIKSILERANAMHAQYITFWP